MSEMIKKCFKILDILDEKALKKLSFHDIHRWEDFLSRKEIPGISPDKKEELDKKLVEFSKALDEKDYRVFSILAPNQHWRLYKTLRDQNRVCFIDIETTGLQFFNDYITMVGIYDGNEYMSLISGDSLTEENLGKALEPFDMLVTYHGLKFDIPFIRYKFPDLDICDRLHFDVYFSAKKLKLGENLKEVEEKLKIWRDAHIADITGYKAVELWEKKLKGDKEAMELLLNHNRNDVTSLCKIADEVYQRLGVCHDCPAC